MDEVYRVANDLMFAEDLQLEEVIRFSARSAGGTNCAVCGQAIPLVDASWKPDNCDHVMCITCFGQLASDSHAAELPKCPMASCQFSPRASIIGAGIDSLVLAEEDAGSGKGKEPATYVMLQERGECSRAVAAGSGSGEFYCTICMETVDAVQRFAIAGCTHAFCASCVRQYIAAKVEENVLSIGCPDPGCNGGGALHPEACRGVIPPRLFQRWGDALCDSALSSLKFYCPFSDCSALLVDDPGDGEAEITDAEWGDALCDSALSSLKFYCPFSDCSALLVDDPGDGEAEITDAECPHCRRMFCARCKVPWHDGATCAEFQKLGKDERGRDDLLLRNVAQESKWQRCPKCKMCGHCFCYLCASPMSRQNHHCKTCKRTCSIRRMERKCVDAAMIRDEVLAEELQVQEAILFSAFQEMTIQDDHDTTSDESMDYLILLGQDQTQESKRPFSGSTDRGESSSTSSSTAVAAGDAGELYCTICMETVPESLRFSVSSCRHAFCVFCIGQYVAAKIGESAAHVACPDPGCGGGAVEPESCRGVVPSELLDRWGLLLCEAAIVVARRRPQYCPFRDCSEPLLAAGGTTRAAAAAWRRPSARAATGCSARGAWCRGTTASAARSSRSSARTSAAGRT
uniref:RBR-type E3 ubiquitin transferase n=1 Tax=Oryza brachyantha TaxID=4533 RepID=J3MXH8_ORYBR